MATIGNVVISVFASTKGLNKSLTSAQKRIKKFAKSAIKNLKTISVGVGVAIAGAVAAGIAVVNKYAQEIDKLAKTSSKLGVTVEALQRLQYQAELSGVGADKFNKAFNRMAGSIADADNGLQTAVRSFEKLGLDIQYVKSLSADQQFYAIAEALKSVKNQNDQIDIAKGIFGAGATGVLNTLRSDLVGVGEEFDALGISITQSGAKMVEAYNDSKTKMSAIFSGFGIKLTEQLALPFQKVIEFINKTIIEMGGMEAVANKFARFIVNAIKVSIQALKVLIDGFRELQNIMLKIDNAKLAPKVAKDVIKYQFTGEVGESFKKSLENSRKIAENDEAIKNGGITNSLDKLLDSLGSSLGGQTASDVTTLNSAQNALEQNTTAPLGKISIDMQTDTGKVAGEIFGEPAFLAGLKSFSERQTNEAARAATV